MGLVKWGLLGSRHVRAFHRVDTQIAGLPLSHSGRILATLIRFLGDFDLAEETLRVAFP